MENESDWKENELQNLLQVVKWFTKCLFYSWLLKICIGLSFVSSSFVRGMFWKCSCFPADCICHHMHQTVEAQGRCLCLEAKNRCTHNKVWLPFFSSQMSTSVCSLIIWKMSINASFTTGKHLTGERYIMPTICLSPRAPLSRRRGALTCVRLLSCCSLTTCKMASVPTWTFSSSHRNKKPYYTVARM